MNSRKNQMSRERCSGCNICGFSISYLSYHYYIRVLPQKAPQSRGECKPYRFLYRHLIDTLKIILNRVLSSHNIHILFVKR